MTPWRHLFSCLVSMSLALGWADAAAAQAWSRFRGPNGSGLSADTLPATWTEQDQRWRTKLPGIGHSSPVVWGPLVFLESADPETATRYLVAIEAGTGRIAWTREFPSSHFPIHARSSFASSSPAVDGDRVYAAWASPEETMLVALDHRGQTAWERKLGPMTCQHGFGSSPLLFEDLVILNLSQEKAREKDDAAPEPGPSQILAVDRETGATRWSAPRTSKTMSYSVPCLFTHPDGTIDLIGCSTAEGMYALDPRTGHPRWSLPLFSMRTVSSPYEASGLLIGSTGSGGGGNYVVAVRPGAEPRVEHEFRKQAPYVPTSVAKDGLLFLWMDKGIVTCVRLADGSQAWQERIGGNYSGSPVIAGDKIYCIDEDGQVVVLAASDTFQLLGRTPLGEPSRSTPAVADGRMYLRTYSHLVSIGRP